MKGNIKILILSITAVLCFYMIICTALLMDGWGVLIRIAIYAISGAGLICSVVFFAIKKDALLKTALVLVSCAAIIFTVVLILNAIAGLNELETDGEKIEKLKALIISSGGWAMAVYVLVQVLQVVILPLPAAVCYIPGAQIWEPWVATLLASLGVIIGALICYFLGKVFGRRVVEWIAGKEVTDKYADTLGKRGKVIFVIMQILPFFPDDILCLVAGLTNMNFLFYLATMLIVRPLIVAAYCFLGSGTVIPFSGWGIPVWIAIFVVCVILSVLSFIYQDRIEKWLVKKITKRTNEDLDADKTKNEIE